jgi:hypothetical protein
LDGLLEVQNANILRMSRDRDNTPFPLSTVDGHDIKINQSNFGNIQS